MSTNLLLAGLCGGVFAVSLWSLLRAGLPRPRALLLDRVQSQVLDVSPSARQRRASQRVDPLPLVGSFASAIVYRIAAHLPRATRPTSAAAGTERPADDADGIPARALAYAVAATLTGVLVGLGAAALMAGSGGPLVVLVAGPVLGGVAGIGLMRLTTRKKAVRRTKDVLDELPGVLELTTLSLSAGESVPQALRRASVRGRGPLSDEVAHGLRAHEAGEPLGECLDRLGQGLGPPEARRFFAHLIAALERGSPLVGVLTAQMSELRQARRRDQLEAAGKRDIVMLTPLVFVILPTTVLFAVFPGISVLNGVL